MSIQSGYRYSSLTSAIADKRSPVRVYLDSTFPNRTPIQTAYRAAALAMRVPGGDANPGTLGAAFDFMVRMVLDPRHVPAVALTGFMESREDVAAVRELIGVAGEAAYCRTSAAPDELMRASLAIALCAEVYRTGMVMPGSPLATVHPHNFTVDSLMQLATPNAIEQLGQLHDVAVQRLFPTLPYPAGRMSLGTTFDASRLCAADADVVVDGFLLEVKTRLGTKKSNGDRYDTLSLEDLYQLLGYVLWDHSDEYSIDSVGFYSGRYGRLVTWPLDQFLRTLGGGPIDIADERQTVWGLLGGS